MKTHLTPIEGKRTLCGRRPKGDWPPDEYPEDICRTCLRAAERLYGLHHHFLVVNGKWRMKWPRIVWDKERSTIPMPWCCDLMQNNYTTGGNVIVWSNAA